jgi:uncharacterized protein (TIGR00369 family)
MDLETNKMSPEQFFAGDRLGALLGARFVSLHGEVCVYEYEAAPSHYNPGDMLHGGALYTVMDSSQGMLAYSLMQPPMVAVTGTATIKYLAPVRRGRVVVTTRVANREGRKLFLRSEAVDDSGTTVAILDEVWITVSDGRDVR